MGFAENLAPNERLSLTMVILSSVYLTSCGVFTVVARTYLYNYYSAAHVAIFSVLCGLFVLSHHTFQIRRLLLHSERTFAKVQLGLNCWYLSCSLVTAIAYSALAHLALHTNFDYLAALLLSWFNVALLAYLAAVVWHKMRTDKSLLGLRRSRSVGPAKSTGTNSSSEEIKASRRSLRTTTPHGASRDDDSVEMSEADISNNSGAPLVREKTFSGKRRACAYFFRFLYYLAQVLLVLGFLCTAFHPCSVLDDTVRYRENDGMVTVNVPGHRPIALFLRCAGSGNETVLFENGLGGTVYIGWSFIPLNLSQTGYRVCAYDRRGYGWSEGFEHDYAGVLPSQPQWTASNIDFLERLIDSGAIPTPFYYVGHSYGGHHLTMLALRRPELIKGLVYLDSARFSPLSTLRSLMGVVANLKASGLLRLSLDLNIVKYRSLFSAVVDFDGLSSLEEERVLSTFRSGTFFASYLRESLPLVYSKFAFQGLRDALSNHTIDKPVLVIDAGDRSTTDWFPKSNFPQYNSSFRYMVEGTDHQTLVYSVAHAWKTKDLIDEFIRQTSIQ